MNTEPWWTCSKCKAPVARVGKPHPEVWEKHRLICDPYAGGSIKQWTQRDLREWRKRSAR